MSQEDISEEVKSLYGSEEGYRQAVRKWLLELMEAMRDPKNAHEMEIFDASGYLWRNKESDPLLKVVSERPINNRSLSTKGRRRLLTHKMVAEAIRDWIIKHGTSPSYEQLRQVLKVGSTKTVSRYLNELERDGYIQHLPGSREMKVLKIPGFQIPKRIRHHENDITNWND